MGLTKQKAKSKKSKKKQKVPRIGTANNKFL